MRKKISIWDLLICIAIPELTGALSALLAGNSGRVYQTLRQPPLSPPGWLFPVAWTILYALMGVASYLIYQSAAAQREKKTALCFYTAQLLVNFSWSIVFFRFGAFHFSVAILLLLDLLVFLTIIQFYKIRKSAACLLIPYLLWLLFATYLNIGVAVLN